MKILILISKVSNKPNICITRVVLVRKYSALQEQPCGSSLSCPRSAEHIKSYLPNFKLQISKLKFWIAIEQFSKFWFRWPPPHTISSKIKIMLFQDLEIKICLCPKDIILSRSFYSSLVLETIDRTKNINVDCGINWYSNPNNRRWWSPE